MAQTHVDPQLEHAFTDGLAIAEQPSLKPIETLLNRRVSDRIRDVVQPFPERDAPILGLVEEDLERGVHNLLSVINDSLSTSFPDTSFPDLDCDP